MSDRRGIKYRLMLMNVSTEMKKRNISLDLLRFALADFVNMRTNLEKAETAFDLFFELDNAGHISPSDLKILITMLEVLGMSSVRSVITKHGFRNPDVSPSSVFPQSRIRLLNIGKVLNKEKVKEVAGIYHVPGVNCSNQWKLLQYLLDNKDIDIDGDFTEIIEIAGLNLDPVESPPVVPPSETGQNDESRVIGNMPSHSVDRDKFLDLLAKVGQWYQAREKVNMVKVLLKDILKDNYNVWLIKDFTEFFEKLHEAGKLHPKNLTIIYELVRCTGHFGLEPEIRKFVPLCPNLKEFKVVEISNYRIKLKEFGNALLPGDWDTIDGLCNLPRKGYKDPWFLIMDLEEQRKLTEASLSDFIDKLESHSVHAVAKLR